jgi:hypothetical protein
MNRFSMQAAERAAQDLVKEADWRSQMLAEAKALARTRPHLSPTPENFTKLWPSFTKPNFKGFRGGDITSRGTPVGQMRVDHFGRPIGGTGRETHNILYHQQLLKQMKKDGFDSAGNALSKADKAFIDGRLTDISARLKNPDLRRLLEMDLKYGLPNVAGKGAADAAATKAAIRGGHVQTGAIPKWQEATLKAAKDPRIKEPIIMPIDGGKTHAKALVDLKNEVGKTLRMSYGKDARIQVGSLEKGMAGSIHIPIQVRTADGTFKTNVRARYLQKGNAGSGGGGGKGKGKGGGQAWQLEPGGSVEHKSRRHLPLPWRGKNTYVDEAGKTQTRGATEMGRMGLRVSFRDRSLLPGGFLKAKLPGVYGFRPGEAAAMGTSKLNRNIESALLSQKGAKPLSGSGKAWKSIADETATIRTDLQTKGGLQSRLNEIGSEKAAKKAAEDAVKAQETLGRATAAHQKTVETTKEFLKRNPRMTGEQARGYADPAGYKADMLTKAKAGSKVAEEEAKNLQRAAASIPESHAAMPVTGLLDPSAGASRVATTGIKNLESSLQQTAAKQVGTAPKAAVKAQPKQTAAPEPKPQVVQQAAEAPVMPKPKPVVQAQPQAPIAQAPNPQVSAQPKVTAQPKPQPDLGQAPASNVVPFQPKAGPAAQQPKPATVSNISSKQNMPAPAPITPLQQAVGTAEQRVRQGAQQVGQKAQQAGRWTWDFAKKEWVPMASFGAGAGVGWGAARMLGGPVDYDKAAAMELDKFAMIGPIKAGQRFASKSYSNWGNDPNSPLYVDGLLGKQPQTPLKKRKVMFG